MLLRGRGTLDAGIFVMIKGRRWFSKRAVRRHQTGVKSMPKATGEELLRIHSVSKKTGIPTSTLYAMVAAGTFPRPIGIKGMRIKAWPLSRVEKWIAEQMAEEVG